MQFACFRIALGLFLLSHFAWLTPYVGEIYGEEGMYPHAISIPFPNILSVLRSDDQYQGLTIGLSGLGLLLAIGFQRRLVAVVLWYGWACFTHRVPLLYIPSEGLVGWMLLLTATVPGGERWSLRPRTSPNWRMPHGIIASAWIVLGVGYLASGIDKLGSPSWREGTALRAVLTSPMAYWDRIAKIANELPIGAVQVLSWSVLAAEIAFVGLIWTRITRPVVWIVMTVLHLLIRATLSLHTVTDPFLIAQILVLDVNWLRRGIDTQVAKSQDLPCQSRKIS